MSWSSGLYAPTLGAYLRKYKDNVQKDMFDIKDEKKQYFYIDTSQYMTYSNETLSDEYHCHHGPQPDGEVLDSTWLNEMDKFLKGEENNLKGHKRYLNYEYELKDKSFPTADAVADLMLTTMNKMKINLLILKRHYQKSFCVHLTNVSIKNAFIWRKNTINNYLKFLKQK